MSKNYPLVHEQHFAHATRDTGYRSTASAIAELVDNSAQANAANIHVIVRQNGRGVEREITLAVWDNGCGMDADVLQQAIQFGGSTRFNDRTGLGRFGMGLPNSSVSQARRLEVFTWRSPHKILFSYLDLDEIIRGELRAVPKPTAAGLPSWAPPPTSSGTLVVWTKCDRLDHRKASTIARKLERELGRIFRHLLWDGICIRVNDAKVVPVDPLFCHPQAELNGAEEYSEPLVYNLKVPDKPRCSAPVIVRFSKLPVAEWHGRAVEEKRRLGIVGGAGVSVVRAGREIAHGWYFMVTKRRQNYDDWWRCEISFDPALDEWFGVTHSKQGIRPTQELNEILGPDIERIARQLSGEVRTAFAAVSAQRLGSAERRAMERDRRLPRIAVKPPSRNGLHRTVSHLTYKVEVSDLSSSCFFDWKLDESQLSLSLNRNHPFFKQIYERLQHEGVEWLQRDLDCMLLAFARASEMKQRHERDNFRAIWSDVLATFVGE